MNSFHFIFGFAGIVAIECTKLAPSDGATDDYFSISVAISDKYAINGAYYDDISGIENQGSVYVYEVANTTWGNQIKLVASDGSAYDNFGVSVSLHGDYLLIGAIGDNMY